MEAADEHSRRAEDLRQAARSTHSANSPHATSSPYAAPNPDSYQCGDRDMSDQLTSGGERLVPQVPCWDPSEELAERRRVAAAREDVRARDERRAATKLVEAELAACRGSRPTRSSTRRSPIAARSPRSSRTPRVVPCAACGSCSSRCSASPLHGWTRRSLATRARFERLGEPPPICRRSDAGARRHDHDHRPRRHLEVLIETRNDVAAHVALARAQALVRSRTAGR